MRLIVLIAQAVMGVLATPVVIDRGLRGAINLVSGGDFNRAYQLHFIASHFATYVTAAVLALVFWLTGFILARLLGASRRPGFVSLLVTLVLALGFAHLSQMPVVAPFETAVYSRLYVAVPTIAYPLIGAILAAFIAPGRRRG